MNLDMPNNNKITSISQLLKRAESLEGLTVQSLLKDVGFEDVSFNRSKSKGLIGKLTEIFLGASCSNDALPDFIELGVELKTLPITKNGEVIESTFVTSAINLDLLRQQTWETSSVKKKLNQVLWVPYDGETAKQDVLLSRFARPFLVELTAADEMVLSEDFYELKEYLLLGKNDKASAKVGRYLQLRPKAAHSKVLQKVCLLNSEHEFYMVPKGFYLRKIFTQKLVSKHLLKL